MLLRRPMSIYDVQPGRGRPTSPPTAAPEIIQLLYKIVGRGTRLMARLKPGDPVELLVPLGHGFLRKNTCPLAQNAR